MEFIKIIHNLETGEIIEREMTPEEVAQRELDEAEAEAEKVERLAKEEQRLALLDRLGLTEDEAKLILG